MDNHIKLPLHSIEHLGALTKLRSLTLGAIRCKEKQFSQGVANCLSKLNKLHTLDLRNCDQLYSDLFQ
jgi:hypothetical protein